MWMEVDGGKRFPEERGCLSDKQEVPVTPKQQEESSLSAFHTCHTWSGGGVEPAQQKSFRCKLRRIWKGKKGIRIEATESSDGRRQPGSEKLSREGRCQKKGLFEMPWGRAQVTVSKVAAGMMAKAKVLPEVQKHRLQMRRLSSCGSRAQLLRGMWDLPRPGLEPVSPALAGRFSTTAPPGKPIFFLF
ncbi:hypothetical protein J1605_017397 [Eschrichtius robustus]|uniref:Uncharacterized protein n=1 Tax=Eschrichtius robustus TaxID=9764 RepID=A0AB34I0Y5_ESCRO|nr:hypothetical protein J1605_017397 [Eschrichtius robustus]